MAPQGPIWAVPTRSRYQSLPQHTLAALRASGVPAKDIHVWVDDDEADLYARHLPVGSYGALKVGPVGSNLRDKRNHIVRQYPPGTQLIQCDDDVQAYWVARTRKRPLFPLVDLPAVARWAYTTCATTGIGLWGLYPIDNPFFMRRNATTDLRYIAGPTWGITVTGDTTELVTLDDKEDFERTVRYYLRDGGVLRLNWASYRTNYYGANGGMQTYRTPTTIDEGAARLAALYPDLVTLKRPPRGRQTWEVKLKGPFTMLPPLPAPDTDGTMPPKEDTAHAQA